MSSAPVMHRDHTGSRTVLDAATATSVGNTALCDAEGPAWRAAHVLGLVVSPSWAAAVGEAPKRALDLARPGATQPNRTPLQ
jgi:hypothetical protein